MSRCGSRPRVVGGLARLIAAPWVAERTCALRRGHRLDAFLARLVLLALQVLVVVSLARLVRGPSVASAAVAALSAASYVALAELHLHGH